MSPSDQPVRTSTSTKDAQQTHRYVIQPRLHPHGWKLEMRDDADLLLFEVIRHPTTPTRYKLRSINSENIAPMKIKSTTIKDFTRYTLCEGNQERLSIRSFSTSPLILLRNQQRKTIARFTPMNPQIVLLGTSTTSIARLRLKEKPAPLHFQIECETLSGLQWLYAIILYSLAQIEASQATQILSKKTDQNIDNPSTSGETVTP